MVQGKSDSNHGDSTPAKVTATIAKADPEIPTGLTANAPIKDVKYTSSNEDVATVSDNGKVTAAVPGKAAITATTVDGVKTAECEVTVPYEVKNTSGDGGKHAKNKDGDLQFVSEYVGNDLDTYPAFTNAGCSNCFLPRAMSAATKGADGGTKDVIPTAQTAAPKDMTAAGTTEETAAGTAEETTAGGIDDIIE